MSIGGTGSCALPGPNISPRPHANRSSKLKLEGRVGTSFMTLDLIAGAVGPTTVPCGPSTTLQGFGRPPEGALTHPARGALGLDPAPAFLAAVQRGHRANVQKGRGFGPPLGGAVERGGP